MPESNAWLLSFKENTSVAIGEHELLHIITEPELQYIPKSQKYCQNVVYWQDNILPVTNISGYVNNSENELSDIIGVVAYNDPNSSIKLYSAIDLTSIPKKIKVDDNQQCSLTNELESWREFTISCFKHNEKVTPIINLSSFFQKK